MRIRVWFYIIFIFTVAAFSWWTYSLIFLSNEVHVDNRDIYEFEAYKATRLLLQNSKFRQDDDTVFTEMSQGTHKIYLDTARIRSLIKQSYPHVALSFKNNTITLTPEPDILEKNEEDKERKTRMYFIEGVVFLILLLMGFSWLYNRFNAIIKLNQQKSNFLLAVTHELKTPMASVKLFLQTIQRRDLAREQLNPMIENCIEDVNRLNDLAENMLLATRIEGNSYQYNFQTLDLSALLSGITENYSKKYGNKYTFAEEIEDNIEIQADVFSLTLAVNNLIENAMKYSNPGSTITIKLYMENQSPVLFIMDEGIGIPYEERKNIFQKFYRVGSESTRTTKGTGLGLYIVKQIMENHKALIEVLDNKPQGTKFKISMA